MSWTHEYEIDQEVKAYCQGAWRRGAVVSRRLRSLMVPLGKYGYINIYDQRSVQPWQPEQGEDPIDISRRSLVRLREMAFRRYDETVDGSLDQSYWDGCIRALAHILEMEDEQ